MSQGRAPWGEAVHPSSRYGNYACQQQGLGLPSTKRREKIPQAPLERLMGWGAPDLRCWSLMLEPKGPIRKNHTPQLVAWLLLGSVPTAGGICVG